MTDYFNPKKVFVKGTKKNLIIDFISNSYTQIDSSIPYNSKNENSQLKNWEYPAHISNCIINVNTLNGLFQRNNFSNLLKHLEYLLCKDIVLIIHEYCDIIYLNTLTELINTHHIQSCLLLLKFDANYQSNTFINTITSCPAIYSSILFESPFNNTIHQNFHFTMAAMDFSQKNKRFFNVSLDLYYESHSYNPYFNKKLTIGVNGEIKNAPELNNYFGYIQDINSSQELLDIVSQKSFQTYWKIHKGICEECKNCEFRYLCVDNRVPIEDQTNTWIFKEKCSYNPKFGNWKL